MYFSDNAIKNDILDNWEWLKDASESFIDDNLTQMADGAVPVYNGDIIKDWAEMPSEFDDSWQELSPNREETTIVNLMRLDLYNYYQDAYRRIYQEVLAEELRLAEEAEEEEEN